MAVARIPAGAADSAVHPDHDDYYAERCTKDLKLVHFALFGDGEEVAVAVTFRFNELRVADELSIHYLGVCELSITTGGHNPASPTRLGGLAVDEEVAEQPGRNCSRALKLAGPGCRSVFHSCLRGSVAQPGRALV